MKKKDWYENWFSSEYYSILYQDRDQKEAENFINTLIAHLQPEKGCRMLDIACGEGRHAIQLEENGYDVTGIDLSYQSIMIAKQKESERLHFYVHDMRFPFYINYFDYAFNFFTSFGYFATERDHIMAAKSFASSLKPGGILAIDYLNAHFTLNNIVDKATITKNEIDFHITKHVENKHIIKNIKFTDKVGCPQHFAERVAAFTLEDFKEIFAKANLTLLETFGDYQLNAYNEAGSPRLIMIFKK